MKVLILSVVLLAGCAAPQGDYAKCVVPVTRDAGMGVRVPGCVAWTIGSLR